MSPKLNDPASKQHTVRLNDPASNDLRPLPREQKNSMHYEELWRTVKLAGTTGDSIVVHCPADKCLRIKRGVQKRKVKDTPYNHNYPAATLRCTYIQDEEGADCGVQFTLFHPIQL